MGRNADKLYSIGLGRLNPSMEARHPSPLYPDRSAHLEIPKRKILPDTQPWAVRERQYVLVPLNRLGAFPDPILPVLIHEPPLRLEFLPVGSPELFSLVDVGDRAVDCRAFGDGDMRDGFAGCGGNGRGEWDDIVFRRLSRTVSGSRR